MKLKVVLVGLAAGMAVSSALAAPPADKGKPAEKGPGCKPQIMVVLKGTLASTPGASATALSVNVTSANRWGRGYVKAGQPYSVGVNTATKIRRQGAKTLVSLQKDDRVLVEARVCKADLKDDALAPLTARMVVAHPANAANGKDNGNKGKDDDDD